MCRVTTPRVIRELTIQTKFGGPFEFELTRVNCILKEPDTAVGKF